MKRLLGPIVIIVGVLVIGYVGVNKYSAKSLEADKTADIARIRQSYFERVGWLRTNPDDKAYKDEVSTFFRNYFKDVNEHLNRFGGNKEFDDYLDELDKRAGKGGKGDSQLSDKKAAWEYVKKDMDLFKSGNYAPLWTSTDKGMRLDIVSGDVGMEGGKPVIKMPFVLWGAQREMRDEGRNTKRMMTSATFHSNWKLYDEKGKLLGEVNADGANDVVDYPERYIELFPPQMVIGTFPMELLPAEVAKLEINFTVNSHANSGGEAVASYTWKMDTPAEWKLKPGEKWEGAQDDIRPEEEIDPAAAAKKQAKR